ncbi:MAG: hypothetical protein KF819_40510 [Labilithrix sp.]|nr:hypothetical protein [Labilithrix sp.]
MLRSRLQSALFVLPLALVGCNGCKRDRPYVPYAVGDAPSAVPDAGIVEAPPAASTGASAAEPSLVAPPNATRWRIEDLELVAPPERELVLALVRDFDGDGKKDALAVVRSIAPAPDPAAKVKPVRARDETVPAAAAELVYYSGASPTRPTPIASAPPPRVDPSCTPVARLERVGPRSAFAELGTSCTRGASARALFVVRLAKEPAVAFDLAIADPAGAPRLAIDVDGADRDRDGIDDVTMRVTIEGGSPPFEPGPRLSAKLAFFDRPAGPSRDPDEPEASLRAIAAQATAKASKAKDAPQVPVLVQQMRSLHRAMCLEGGAPRLSKLRGGGGAVSCGASKPLEDAGVAEVRAFVTMGDALRALAASDAAQLPPATKTSAKSTEIATLLNQVAPIVQARSARVAGVTVASSRAAHPEWGPLAFEPSGMLLVRSASGVSRVDPDSGESAESDVQPWGLQVFAPDGKSRWLEAYHACEGVALRATFAPVGEGETDMKDVLLPVPPPLGSRCAGGRGEAAKAIPIAWSARGLEALVAGQPLLIRPEASHASILASPLGEAPPPGSPRSPGGRALAVATPQGVLVKATRASRLRAPELEPYEDLRHCTTNDDATRVACVKRGKVVVASFDPSP